MSTRRAWRRLIPLFAGVDSLCWRPASGKLTGDVAGAVRAMRQIDAGVLQVNWSPLWRATSMPYGGLKASGIGKEGPDSPSRK